MDFVSTSENSEVIAILRNKYDNIPLNTVITITMLDKISYISLKNSFKELHGCCSKTIVIKMKPLYRMNRHALAEAPHSREMWAQWISWTPLIDYLLIGLDQFEGAI